MKNVKKSMKVSICFLVFYLFGYIYGTCSNTEYSVLVCQYKKINLKCPDYSSINILTATYGRSDSFTCSEFCKDASCVSVSLSNTNCNAAWATKRFRELCNGRQSCEYTLQDSLMYVDPCITTYKYSIINYECIPDQPVRSLTACDYDTMTIECYNQKVINVTSVFYGRSDLNTCTAYCLAYNRNSCYNTTSCSSNLVFNIFSSLCNGLYQCSYIMDPSNLGNLDPCPGIFKYNIVEFTCI